jgi:polysaccharide export outer membrane protein
MINKFCRTIAAFLLPVTIIGCASQGGGTGIAEPQNMPAESRPVAAEFTLGVGDAVEISVYRHDDMKTATKINPSGRILLPLVGEIQAAGKTVMQLRDEVSGRLAKYFVDPQVIISVSSLQSQRVLVLGEVRNPGIFVLDTDLTVLDAVARAGGWTVDAKTDAVVLLRQVSGRLEPRSLDVASAIKAGRLVDNSLLQRNDIIFVPTKKIADVARFMGYLASIISPIVLTEGGIVLWPQMIDALNGKTSGSVAIPTR